MSAARAEPAAQKPMAAASAAFFQKERDMRMTFEKRNRKETKRGKEARIHSPDAGLKRRQCIDAGPSG
ncbi:hypothetical protein GCM10009107_26500 [Ideonella azotifigens]|uniref:Uncharacterized protein n=1 Tax=Ideonella azotifigens TaxID=513160 RepID=A0ABN1K1U4_9BURK